MGFISIFTSLALASAAIAQNCPIQFDGRVPAGSTPASFDTTTSPFGTKFIFGQSSHPPYPLISTQTDVFRPHNEPSRPTPYHRRLSVRH